MDGADHIVLGTPRVRRNLLAMEVAARVELAQARTSVADMHWLAQWKSSSNPTRSSTVCAEPQPKVCAAELRPSYCTKMRLNATQPCSGNSDGKKC